MFLNNNRDTFHSSEVQGIRTVWAIWKVYTVDIDREVESLIPFVRSREFLPRVSRAYHRSCTSLMPNVDKYNGQSWHQSAA
jgi:hypothetical protein